MHELLITTSQLSYIVLNPNHWNLVHMCEDYATDPGPEWHPGRHAMVLPHDVPNIPHHKGFCICHHFTTHRPQHMSRPSHTHACIQPPTYVTISQVAVQNMSVATHKIMMRLSLAISKLDICTSRWPQHRVNGGGCEMMVQGLHG